MTPFTAVAVSGGVDSLVAAWLLKQDGHRVVGVHFTTGFGSPDRFRLQPMARKLGIAIETMDLSGDFRAAVVDYFIEAYRRGETPNPCLVCNPVVKFGVLLDRVAAMGANGLATGHYAKIVRDATGGCRLVKGVDRRKDQSYFLAFTKPERLKRLLFPLGDMTKTAVRALAEREGLIPANARESQDVCFIDGEYPAFLCREGGLSARPGPIADTFGNVVGRHEGLHRYTVGQRRGIGVPAAEPYYVIRLEPEKNRLVVGHRQALCRESCRVTGLNWLREPSSSVFRTSVRLRYRHSATPAEVTLTGGGEARIRFSTPQAAVTPGQGAVFYDGDEVLGGGWIATPRNGRP